METAKGELVFSLHPLSTPCVWPGWRALGQLGKLRLWDQRCALNWASSQAVFPGSFSLGSTSLRYILNPIPSLIQKL